MYNILIGTVVRCHSASYYEIPVNDIPDDVTELYMDGNKIKAIGQEINKFTKLEKLWVFSEHFVTKKIL